MTIINIILCAFLFCYRGRGGKFWYYALMIPLIALQVHTPLELIGWVWVLVVMGSFPTNCLMSATHGEAPKRDDHKAFRWMRAIAEYFAKDNWYLFGCYFGVMRALPAMIAIPMTGDPLIRILVLHGFIYYAAGRFSAWFELSMFHLWMTRFMKLNDVRYFLCKPVKVAEVLTGALMGLLIN